MVTMKITSLVVVTNIWSDRNATESDSGIVQVCCTTNTSSIFTNIVTILDDTRLILWGFKAPGFGVAFEMRNTTHIALLRTVMHTL